MTPKDIELKALEVYPPNVMVAKLNFDRREGYIAGATAERESNTYGFAEWANIEGWDYCHKPKHWFKQNQDKYYTTDSLFQLFLTTKTTTP